MKFTEADVSKITGIMNGDAPQNNEGDSGNAGAGDEGSNNNQGGASNDDGSSDPPPSNNQGDAGSGAAAANNSPFDITTLGFKTPDDLKSRLQRAEMLEEELKQLNEYKAGPKFKSDRHKFVYNLAESAEEGMELNKVRQLLDIAAIDLNNTPDQSIRFEAFKLRPENKGLTQDELGNLFLAEEEERFGSSQNPDNPQTETQKIRAKIATTQAKEQLQSVLKDWEQTRTVAKSPEDIAREKFEYRQHIQSELSGFAGINSIKLQALDEKGEKVEGSMNFKIDPSSQLKNIVSAIEDPQGWWDNMLTESGVITAEGKVNNQKFAELVSVIQYRSDLLNQAYQQGRADQISDKLKGARNLQDNNGGGNSGNSNPPVANEVQARNQAAMKAAGMI